MHATKTAEEIREEIAESRKHRKIASWFFGIVLGGIILTNVVNDITPEPPPEPAWNVCAGQQVDARGTCEYGLSPEVERVVNDKTYGRN